MYDVGLPPEFFYGLENPAGKKYGPFAIVVEKFPVFIGEDLFSLEIILVVYELHLHPCGRYR